MMKHVTIIASTLAASLATQLAAAHAQDASEGAVTLFEEAEFVPVDPARPERAAIAVLKGDPETEPSDMLMRMGKGESAMHVHSADYRLVIISGRMRHWFDEDEKESASILGPGSYWFQPGGDPHGGECLDDECLMFISWSGPRDTMPVE